jgi:hypothetical protein
MAILAGKRFSILDKAKLQKKVAIFRAWAYNDTKSQEE